MIGWVLLAVGCSGGKATGTTPSSSTGVEPPPCDPSAADAMASGTWTSVIDAVPVDGCDNGREHALGVEVGEVQALEVGVDGTCLTLFDGEMTWEGVVEAGRLDLVGSLEFEDGTCVWGIRATMTGELVDDATFTFRVDAVADVIREGGTVDGEWHDLPGACDLLTGTATGAAVLEFPCELAFEGTAMGPR